MTDIRQNQGFISLDPMRYELEELEEKAQEAEAEDEELHEDDLGRLDFLRSLFNEIDSAFSSASEKGYLIADYLWEDYAREAIEESSEEETVVRHSSIKIDWAATAKQYARDLEIYSCRIEALAHIAHRFYAI